MRAELKKKAGASKSGQKQYDKLCEQLKTVEKEMKAVKIAMHEIDYDESLEKDLSAKKAEEERAVRELTEKVADLESRLGGMKFEFRPVQAHFGLCSARS